MTHSFQDALKCLEAGDHAAALPMLAALVDDPACAAVALGHRAWHYFSTRDYAKALDDYDRLAAFAPDAITPAVELTIAECLIESGRQGEALELLAAQIKRDPLEPLLFYLLLRIRNRAIDRETFLDNARLFSPNAVAPVIRANVRYGFNPINGSIGMLLYSIVRNCAPGLVVEIGSFVGLSAVYMAQALKDNRRGRMHCFDLFNQRLPDHADQEREQTEVFTEYMRLAGLEDWVALHPGNSSESIRAAKLKIEKDERSVLFIDGDHTLRGVLEDFNALSNLAGPNSWLLVHDVNYLNAGCIGPALLASRIFGEGNFNQIILPTIDRTGIALLQGKDAAAVKAVQPTFLNMLAQKMYYALGLEKPRAH